MSDYGAIDLSGAIVTASGVAACRPRALTVYGSSTQDGTPTPSAPVAIQSVGPNLAVTPYTHFDWSNGRGVTYTQNADGSITAVGTSTNYAYLGLCTQSDNPFGLERGKTYTLVSSSSKVSVMTVTGGSSRFMVNTVTIPETGNWTVGVGMVAGLTVDETFRFSVFGGNVVAQTAVPHGCVGLLAMGRNQLSIRDANRTSNGVTFAVADDGTATMNGTATGNVTLYVRNRPTPIAAGRYVLSGCPAGGSASTWYLRVVICTKDNATLRYYDDYGSGVTVTVNDGEYFTCFFHASNGDVMDGKVLRPMLRPEGGSTAYQPYESTVTPIPLDGHELRNLPDGTLDELTVDERGHAVLVQRVGHGVFDGSSDEMWSATNNSTSWAILTANIGAEAQSGLNLRCDRLTPNVSALASMPAWSTKITDAWYCKTDGITTLADWREWLASNPLTIDYKLATPVTHDLGTVDMANLTSPDLTAWVTGSPEIELTALLKTGRSTVMWDGEELGAGWTFVSDRREQLLPTDVATIDVPGRDGALFGGVTRAVRQVTLALYVLGPVGERAPHVRELAARLAVDGPRPLMFGDEAPLWRMAVPNAESDSEVYYDAEGYTDVEFTCPDPWLYGEEGSVTVPSGGSVTFTVGGTAPTWPTITASATGSSQGTWILRLDDSSKGIYASIASGVTRPVVADCDARTLTVNNATSMLAPSYDWPELTPGTHTLAMTAGTGAATVTWTERWW